MRQPQWNIYEAVILLESFLQYKAGTVTRAKAIADVSEYLRRMARNSGLEIDDVYRNINGISFQLASMESAYQGEKVSVPTTKLFTDVVEIYNNVPQKYSELLRKARRMVAGSEITNDDQIMNKQEERRDEIIATLKSILREESARNKFGTTLQFLHDSLLREGSLHGVNIAQKDVEHILEDAPWAEYRFHRYYFVEMPDNAVQGKEEICAIDFEGAPEIIKSGSVAPVIVASEIDSRKKEANDFSTWMEKKGLASYTISMYMSAIWASEKYARENGLTCSVLLTNDRELCKNTVNTLFENGGFWELNKQHHNHCRPAISKLLEYYEIENQEWNQNKPPHVGAAQSLKIAEEIDTRPFEAVLKQHYEYGFKYDSIREIMRFRQFADAMGITLPEEDEALKTSILSSGIVIGDKVYCNNDDMLQKLHYIVDNIFSSGVGVIYYKCLYENELEWMESHAIASPDMLKQYLQINIAEYSFSKRFMAKGNRRPEKEVVTNELIRVWGNGPTERIDSLNVRLPYVPLENICRVITGNDLFFIRIAEGEYLLTDCFSITKEEEEDILNFVDDACKEKGFASLDDVPLGDIEENNYELAQSAIYHAIFKKVLSGKYHLNGKILTRKVK